MKVVQLNFSTEGGGGGGGGGGDAEIVGATAGAVEVDISVKDLRRLLRGSQAAQYHQKSPNACQTRRARRPQTCEILDPARASVRYGAALLLVKATTVSWQTCKSPFSTNHACPHGHNCMWLISRYQAVW